MIYNNKCTCDNCGATIPHILLSIAVYERDFCSKPCKEQFFALHGKAVVENQKGKQINVHVFQGKKNLRTIIDSYRGTNHVITLKNI